MPHLIVASLRPPEYNVPPMTMYSLALLDLRMTQLFTLAGKLRELRRIERTPERMRRLVRLQWRVGERIAHVQLRIDLAHGIISSW